MKKDKKKKTEWYSGFVSVEFINWKQSDKILPEKNGVYLVCLIHKNGEPEYDVTYYDGITDYSKHKELTPFDGYVICDKLFWANLTPPVTYTTTVSTQEV